MASTSTPGPARLGAVAEALLALALVAGPWPFGSAPDPARYALTALVALAVALALTARAWAGAPAPGLLVAGLALPAVAFVQLLLGRSVAPVWTAEALLMQLAFLGAAAAWSAGAEERLAALRLAATVLVACGAQALFGAWQSSRGTARVYGLGSEIVTTPFGSYVNHNHFAGLVGMGALLAVGLALGLARRAGAVSPGSLALFGLAAALLATQFASRSRGGLLAAAVGLAALIGLRHAYAHHAPASARGRTLLLAGAAAAMMAFGLLAIPAGTRAHLATLVVGGRDGSAAYRLDIAADTLRLWAARPWLGSGLGAYADALPPLKRAHGDVRTTHAESDALELPAEAGLLGLLALAVLARAALRVAHDQLQSTRDPLRKGLALGAAGGLAALAAHSLVDFNLRLPANALVAMALLGLLAAPRHDAPGPRPAARGLQAGLAALLALAAACSAWRAHGAWLLARAEQRPGAQLKLAALDPLLLRHPYLADGYRLRGLAWRDLAAPGSALAAARLQRAERDLARALALRPQWGEAWADLGWTRLLRGDAGAARAALDRARQLDPTHAGIALTAAEGLLALGDTTAGVRELAELVAREPGWFDEAQRRARRHHLTPKQLEPLAGGDAERLERLYREASQP